jgi:preprotein translocase subunit SecA
MAIAEMKTGEGKTLVAPCRSTSTRLSARASTSLPSTTTSPSATPPWMGRSTSFLGLTTGVIVHGLSDEERRGAYACDITYATNNELGFDYLRDNMKYERTRWCSAVTITRSSTKWTRSWSTKRARR